MAKKTISQKRAEREERENRTLRQIFNVFLLGLAVECYLLIVYRGYVTGSMSSIMLWYQFLRYGAVAGLVLAVAAAIVFLTVRKKTEKKEKRLRLWSAWGFALGVFLAFTGGIMTSFFDDGTGTIAMCVLFPILTVLALIFLLYQHECFLCTCALSGTLFTVWARGGSFISSPWRIPIIVGTVFGAILLVAAAVMSRKVQQGHGKLKGVRIFSADCDYRVIYGVIAAGLAAVVAVLAVPGIAYYLMWAVGILLFAELVYYTTRLM